MGDVIERYLRDVRRSLPSGVEDHDSIVAELRDHLRQSSHARVAEGASPDEAEHIAIARFGDAKVLASQYPSAPAALRFRRAYLYAALFAATWMLAFGLSVVLTQPLRVVFGDSESSRIPVIPLVPGLVITSTALGIIGAHWLLRRWIARTESLTPPRLLLLAATGAFVVRGTGTMIAGAAGFPVGPWNGPSFWIASGLVCFAIAAGYAALYTRSGASEPLASA